MRPALADAPRAGTPPLSGPSPSGRRCVGRCCRQGSVPLDVTHQVLVTEERLARIRAVGNRSARAVAGMLAFYRGRGRTGGAREGPLHDPCTVARLLDPALFTGRTARVEVECESPLGLGRTCVDLHGTTGRAPNAEVMLQADAERFFELLVERLARLP